MFEFLSPPPVSPEELFLRALNERLELSFLKQKQFALLCAQLGQHLLADGKLSVQDARGFSPENVSRLLNGRIRYDRTMILLWMQVLHDWYQSDDFEKAYQAKARKIRPHYFPRPSFTERDAIELMNLAGFATPRQRRTALSTTSDRIEIPDQVSVMRENTPPLPSTEETPAAQPQKQFHKPGFDF